MLTTPCCTGKRVSAYAPVYLAAVLEYMAAEVLQPAIVERASEDSKKEKMDWLCLSKKSKRTAYSKLQCGMYDRNGRAAVVAREALGQIPSKNV